MNFMQPQKISASSPGPGRGRSTAPRPRGSRTSKQLSIDTGDNGRDSHSHSSGADMHLGGNNCEPTHLNNGDKADDDGGPPLTMMKTDTDDSHDDTKCSDDPPIISYESSDDNDTGSASSESSQRARRRQLRKLTAQSDDCWEANLSDDEQEALPLEWNASMVRRQMMRHSENKRDNDFGNNGAVEAMVSPGINMQQSSPTNSNNSNSKRGVFNDSLSSNESEGMSLPEQLLHRRIRRKAMLHKKHEQSLRNQHHQQQEEIKMQQCCLTAENNISIKSTPPANKPSINHLTGNNSKVRASSPLFQDEEFDDDNASTVASSNGASNDYTHSFRSARKKSQEQNQLENSVASPLRSLQRPTCPFPDEADRKRIVGCLAAILASSYAYETAPHLLVKEKQIGKGMPIPDDVAKNRRGDAGKSFSRASDERITESVGNPDASIEVASFDESMHGRNIESNQYPCQNSTHGTAAHPHLQKQNKQKHIIQQSRESQQHRPPITFNSFTAAFQKSKAPSFNNKSHSSIDIGAKKPSPSKPRASLQESFSFASFNNNNSAARIFDKAGSQNPPPSLTTELAEIRHRIRRHTILSELLVSSAEMLLLDSSHAKAFLPMLEGLLTKVEVPEANHTMDKSGHNSMKQSWKGRGFGGGGVPHPEYGNEEAQPASSNVHSASRTTHQNEVAPPLPSDKSSKNTSPPRSSGIQLDVDNPKPGDVYEPFPSSSRVHSSPPPTTYAPLDTAIVEKDLAAPFVQTLTPGAGYRCIALLLLNHLLRDGRGYDARIRQAFKRLAVIVISHELKVGGILRVDLDDEEGLDSLLWGNEMKQQNSPDEQEGFDDADELSLLATRKFEAMEHAIAAKLISMSRNTSPKESSASKDTGAQTAESRSNRQKQSSRAKKSGTVASSPSSSTHGRIALAPKETPLSSQHGISREQLLRGIKVGTAGAVGATLFALTGGLAAPGIAAGVAALAGTSAIAVGVSTVLSSAAAMTTIFGVGGAGLAGYKMHRRTKGLTEFDFHKEAPGGKDTDAELFSTVCISGWLRDARDFQRPWGVSPSQPRIVDKEELLQRFYFIHNPSNVLRVGQIIKHWKGRYFQLWRALRDKYGRDPSNLFPLKEGPRISAELTHEEGEAVDFLLDELGYFPKKKAPKKSPFFGAKSNDDSKSITPNSSTPVKTKELQSAQKQLKDSSLKPKKWLPERFSMNGSELHATLSLFSESETASVNDISTHTVESVTNAPTKVSNSTSDVGKSPPPKHLLTVWDYHANYGGELYTVQWESELLMELCDSVTDQMIEWGISATKTILHTTVLATLMTAVTLPYSLVLAANAIDSSWTMAMERADRAGVELAKSLIDSTAGHRPVVLAGFSMGARVIYSCLKELAKHQEIWEAQQQKKQLPATRRKRNSTGEDQGDDKLKYIREPASIVEDVILMGTPNHVSLKSWEACRRVVAGRVINCYSRKDLILSLMFQMKRFQGILRPVCGTSPVAVNGVENYDVTDLVAAHTDYCLVSGEILKRVRHGQPQRASVSKTEVSAMVTKITVANKDIGGLASLSDETAAARGR